jgi:hypothetical protein
VCICTTTHRDRYKGCDFETCSLGWVSTPVPYCNQAAVATTLFRVHRSTESSNHEQRKASSSDTPAAARLGRSTSPKNGELSNLRMLSSTKTFLDPVSQHPRYVNLASTLPSYQPKVVPSTGEHTRKVSSPYHLRSTWLHQRQQHKSHTFGPSSKRLDILPLLQLACSSIHLLASASRNPRITIIARSMLTYAFTVFVKPLIWAYILRYTFFESIR